MTLAVAAWQWSGTVDKDFGALVGFALTPHGERVTLRLETVSTPPPFAPGDIEETFVILNRNQAAQLANTLFDALDLTPPDRQGRTALRRLFG